ncbi:GTPase ObgE [Candidatus Woesebacteria bacterium]|nr:GTPase ObgE [Candidatus Woesebacteria bacterium]|tara:strand:+ start:103 stop:1056 length:954 start_codon:yes stop_codon:yes gene_type:complete
MFVDEVDVTFEAGDGGEGKVSFGKMEKSGPDGGNGGKGGDIYIVGSSDLTLLSQFRGKDVVAAGDGVPGNKDKKAGKNADDLFIQLPVGSSLADLETKETFELEKVGQEILLCVGGKGGIGNYDLRSSRNTTPKNTIPARKGQKRNLLISLRFIADFGLIGLPSAGKSSLLNELTNTKVKTAAYHFTTLSANLGVLPNEKIIADIPGLIEGASHGKGLGIRFLKHIQRVGLLLHCISSDSSDPLKDYKIVRNELGNFSKDLLEKEEIILLTKHDLSDKSGLAAAKRKLQKLKKEIIETSIYDDRSLKNLYSVLDSGA